MSIEKIRKIAGKVDGWLKDQEGELLYTLAGKCTGKGVIVEIGSWKGKSTSWLGAGSKAGNSIMIYAIDPHIGSSEHNKIFGKVQTFEEFNSNIKNAKIEDIVVPIVATSEEAAEKFEHPVELIFIDGAHEYEMVKLDFELWYPKLIDGGIMAFHDTTWWAGPKKLVKEKIYKSKSFRNIKLVNSITYAEKVIENTAKDRFRNRYNLLQKNIHVIALKSRTFGKKIVKKFPLTLMVPKF